MISGAGMCSRGERIACSRLVTGTSTQPSKSCVVSDSGQTIRAASRNTMHRARRTVVTCTGRHERFNTRVARCSRSVRRAVSEARMGISGRKTNCMAGVAECMSSCRVVKPSPTGVSCRLRRFPTSQGFVGVACLGGPRYTVRPSKRRQLPTRLENRDPATNDVAALRSRVAHLERGSQ